MRFDYDTSYRDGQALLRYGSGRAAYAVLALLLLAAPWALGKYYVGEMTYLFIMCIGSLGLMVLKGYTGQVSLGHSAFLALGAYAHAWMLGKGLPFALSIPMAMGFTALIGLVIGLPAIRVSGLYLAMVTLAFAILTEHVIGHWDAVTGGFNGMSVANPVVFGFDLSGLRPFYYLCLGLLTLVLLGLVNLMRSQTGRAFRGVRDSEAAAYGLGIWVSGYKVLAFVISAGVSGLAGALLAHHVRFLTPEGFGLFLALELVLMVTIGGLGSLRGAIFGAVLIGMLPVFISRIKPMLPEQVSKQFGLEIFVFGLILVLFVLFEPKGINGRWIKLKTFFQTFPLYRKDLFKRGKTYMKSERYK
ncbi:MAG: branched-chain amino acid ABC transporter permease [Betaproteobacteria bacterium]|nr:branched-chain amino acid ABC transporter permease [Betaproteobacteria bacterium]